MAAHARIGKNVKHCIGCGRHVDECGRLSWVGQCLACAEVRMTENLEQLRAGRGEAFERWRSALMRSLQQL